MFAGIEDQQNSLIAEICNQAGRGVFGPNRKPHHGGDSRGHQAGIAQHPEIGEKNGARECLDQVMSNRHRNRGFADAARARDCDKARGSQLSR